jgi:curved DNA-binding protein CbpA
MDDYYSILNLNKNCTKEEIKKSYHKLSLKYHPDKNGGEDSEEFRKIHEAYEILYDDEERKLYDLKLLFKDIDLTEDDYNLMFSYYNRFLESKEYKLMALLYKSIPKKVKEDIIRKFKYRNTQIVKAQKSIDITYLDNNDCINLVIKNVDYENAVLKVIYIFSKTGIYYLYLRKPPSKVIIDNLDNLFTINFFIL